MQKKGEFVTLRDRGTPSDRSRNELMLDELVCAKFTIAKFTGYHGNPSEMDLYRKGNEESGLTNSRILSFQR